MTIEQLAAAVEMSVRNIRNHHTRGLLPAPEVRGRVGYYGPEHVKRLRLIRDLQAEGFNLAAIKRVVEASSGSVGGIAGLRAALLAAFEIETREVVTDKELAKRMAGVEPEVVDRMRRLNLLIPLGDGRFERASPALARAYDRVTSLGLSPADAARLGEALSETCDSIARRFVDLYLEQLWEPFAENGHPEEDWDQTVSVLRALRTLAGDVVLAMFKLRMAAQMEAAADTLLEDQVKRMQLLRAPATWHGPERRARPRRA
jgi:DNA-binding transcriptional MerR regulator